MARPHPCWQKIRQHPIMSSVVVVMIVIGLFIIVAILGYCYKWAWTGLVSYSHPNKDILFQREKTLWDWSQLLLIPLVLAVGGSLFNLALNRNAQEIAKDNQQEATLQEYINKMSELLLDKDNPLRKSSEDDDVQKIARVRTLTVLSRLNEGRKWSVLQFLYESDLIKKDDHIINLQGADFSEVKHWRANLKEAYLKEVYLNNAQLALADLSGAYLGKARLSEAYLGSANLSGADLSDAWLSRANLSEADLSGANLLGTDLSGAILTDTRSLTQQQLDEVYSCKGAILPKGLICHHNL